MSRPAPPVLTVRHDGSTRTFAAGNDVVIGRDLRADVRIAHPLISRAHLVLRFDQGRWVVIDNGSLNGMFVNGRRVPALDIQDGQNVNIGNPDGPRLTSRWAATPDRRDARRRPHRCPLRSGPAGLARPATADVTAADTAEHVTPATDVPVRTRSRGTRRVPRCRRARPWWRSRSPPGDRIGDLDGAGGRAALERDDSIATSMLKMLRPGRTVEAPPGSIKVGRAPDNDIVIPECWRRGTTRR